MLYIDEDEILEIEDRKEFINKVIKKNSQTIIVTSEDEVLKSELVYIFGTNRIIEL